jgi:hypothetical protein
MVGEYTHPTKKVLPHLSAENLRRSLHVTINPAFDQMLHLQVVYPQRVAT